MDGHRERIFSQSRITNLRPTIRTLKGQPDEKLAALDLDGFVVEFRKICRKRRIDTIIGDG